MFLKYIKLYSWVILETSIQKDIPNESYSIVTEYHRYFRKIKGQNLGSLFTSYSSILNP